VAVAGLQGKTQGLSLALAADTELRAHPALRAPEGFGFRVPPFAPAAC
jgi:hypothetical protein